MSCDLRLIKEFLHKELILDIVVWKLVNAEEVESAVILDPCLQLT